MATYAERLTAEPKGRVSRDTSFYNSIKANGPMLDAVALLRYESYRAQHYIPPNGASRFMDEYDKKSNCTSYLTYRGVDLIGSIRCCVYTPSLLQTVPAMEIFHQEIADQIGFQTAFLEVNKFVVRREFQHRGGIGAKFALYSNVIDAVDDSGSSCVIVAIRPEHQRFYRRMFYLPISDEKLYPGLSFRTVLMVCRDLEPAREYIHRHNRNR
jgi:hypothetical protein